MTTPIEIIVHVREDGTLKTFDGVTKRVLEMQSGVKEAQATLANIRLYENLGKPAKQTTDEVGKQITVLGISRREWMRSGSEAAFYARTAMSSLGEVNKGLTDVIGIATQLGESAIFGGAVGVGLAATSIAIGAVVGEMERQKQAEIAAIKPSQDLTTEINNLSGAHDALGKLIAQVFNLTGQESDIVAQAAQKYAELRAPTQQVASARENLIALSKEYQTEQAKVKELEELQLLTGNDLSAELAQRKTRLVELETQMRSTGLAIQKSSQDILAQSKALNESTRLLDHYNSAVPAAAAELRNFTERLTDLASAHKKTQAGFTVDLVKADVKAAGDRVKAEETLAAAREKINGDLLTKLGDLEQQNTDKRSDEYWNYAKSVRELERDITQGVRDQTRERERIERESRKAIADLDFETGQRVGQAQTEQEAARIRLEVDHQRAGLQDRAQSELSVLGEKRTREDEESRHKRELMDEDYRHSREIADRDSAQTVARFQRETREQIQAAQDRQTAELKAIEERKTAEVTAIGERSKAESDAYTESMSKARTAHAERMQQLKDERTETEKWAADLASLQKSGYTIPVRFQYDLLKDVAGPTAVQVELFGGAPSSGFSTPTYGPAYQQGGSFVVPSGYPNDTYPLRVTSGEHVTVTPASQAPRRASVGSLAVDRSATPAPQDITIRADPIAGIVLKQVIGELTRSGAFREGVRLVLNDEMVR